ncbi:bacteriocin, partial [Lacticaseibacillus rhamnosus]|nr:bacteriocin [Lacticaseibacillus rhamnosus]MCT3179925.1 bacteriocin [Lacticaseibacillus rhamnosus]MCT3185427.1 bacteriocin [Lacticaseibacillus rhamnosus]MCT4450331.1 bacteriocin [Lacticaseibacillus rhamnosus]
MDQLASSFYKYKEVILMTKLNEAELSKISGGIGPL